MKKLMFLFVALLFVSVFAVAQPANQGIYTMTVTVLGNGLSVGQGDLAVDNLRPGICYEVIPDPDGLLGTAGGNGVIPVTVDEVAAWTASAIAGDPFADVVINVTVPTALVDQGATSPAMKLTYSGTSGRLTNDGNTDTWFFNPTAGAFDYNLGDGGAASLYVGFNACVPKTTLAGATYYGEGFVIVQYK